jgi:hypothetical protein
MIFVTYIQTPNLGKLFEMLLIARIEFLFCPAPHITSVTLFQCKFS